MHSTNYLARLRRNRALQIVPKKEKTLSDSLESEMSDDEYETLEEILSFNELMDLCQENAWQGNLEVPSNKYKLPIILYFMAGKVELIPLLKGDNEKNIILAEVEVEWNENDLNLLLKSLEGDSTNMATFLLRPGIRVDGANRAGKMVSHKFMDKAKRKNLCYIGYLNDKSVADGIFHRGPDYVIYFIPQNGDASRILRRFCPNIRYSELIMKRYMLVAVVPCPKNIAEIYTSRSTCHN